MKQFLKSATVISAMCFLFSACTEEDEDTTVYGEFSHKITNYKTKQILWFGENERRPSDYELYYHGNKVDLNELAPPHLKLFLWVWQTHFMEETKASFVCWIMEQNHLLSC